jgi:hypothetical protein
MAGDTDLVKEAVQLADDGGDLLGEVARVHGERRPASGVYNRACTVSARGDVAGDLCAVVYSRSCGAGQVESGAQARTARGCGKP